MQTKSNLTNGSTRSKRTDNAQFTNQTLTSCQAYPKGMHRFKFVLSSKHLLFKHPVRRNGQHVRTAHQPQTTTTYYLTNSTYQYTPTANCSPSVPPARIDGFVVAPVLSVPKATLCPPHLCFRTPHIVWLNV